MRGFVRCGAGIVRRFISTQSDAGFVSVASGSEIVSSQSGAGSVSSVPGSEIVSAQSGAGSASAVPGSETISTLSSAGSVSSRRCFGSVLAALGAAFVAFSSCAQPSSQPAPQPKFKTERVEIAESIQTPRSAGQEPAISTVRLIFIGDVMSHTPQIAAARAEWEEREAEAATTAPRETETRTREAAATAPLETNPREYDYSGVFRHVRRIFERADVVVANLETTLRETPPYTGYPAFAAPAELALAMREAGVDIVTTANNHILDKGRQGVFSTIDILN
ncbi:MAG: CapA family protein, partial [Alistipes sp.]|nr:CapA family protein [Alistipes sp.]